MSADPHCSRAYAGLSLSHFNDWSCQLWEQWESTERKADDYAMRANQLDDSDHIVQMILGRVPLFRRQFELAAQHLDRSLALTANDADNLVQIAACMAFLDDAERGERLFLKSLQLNPYRENWYDTYGAWPYMIQRRYDKFLAAALKGPLTDVWVDQPAYIAAAYAFQGEQARAAHYLDLFHSAFSKEILKGKTATPEELVNWLHKANPLTNKTAFANILEGLIVAGLKVPAGWTGDKPFPSPAARQPEAAHVFRKTGHLWQMTFDGKSAQLPEVKGFVDQAGLMAQPGVEAHCTQLMGSVIQSDASERVIDEQARREYEFRIRGLQEAIADAEAMNDLGCRKALTAELDQLTAHLAKALGFGGKTRRVNKPVDRSRSAVIWRIRKITTAHPALGSHLSHSIRTGTFCGYEPEKKHIWQVSLFLHSVRSHRRTSRIADDQCCERMKKKHHTYTVRSELAPMG